MIAAFLVGLEPIVSVIVIGIGSLVIGFKRKPLSSIAFLAPLLSCAIGLLSLIVFAEVASLVYTSLPRSYPYFPFAPIPDDIRLWMFISSFVGPSAIFLASSICSMIFGGLALRGLRKTKKI